MTLESTRLQGLREWQAYKDCRDVIDDFLEQLPIFQALAHTSMRERCALLPKVATPLMQLAWFQVLRCRSTVGVSRLVAGEPAKAANI